MDPVIALTSDFTATSRVSAEFLRAQIGEDSASDPARLVDILTHCQAIRSCADYRMLHAASLIQEERQEAYYGHVCDLIESVGPDGDLSSVRSEFGPDGYEQATAEVGAALTVPAALARTYIHAGAVMRFRLPRTGSLLATGRIDLARFCSLVARTDLVDDIHAAELDAALFERISTRAPMSSLRFRTMVDRVVAKIDPLAVQRERERTRQKRRVTIRPDGGSAVTARLGGILSVEDGARLNSQLDALARSVHPNDPRTTQQLRADALIALATGDLASRDRLACQCPACMTATVPPAEERSATTDSGTITPDAETPGAKTPGAKTPDAIFPGTEGPDGHASDGQYPDTDASDTVANRNTPLAPRPYFHIVVSDSTLLGHDDDPAFLDGHGVIDASLARTLFQEARRTYFHASSIAGTERSLPTDELPSRRRRHAKQKNRQRDTTRPEQFRYRPGSRLAGLVRAGELCCTFPGCNSPAWEADLDHTRPFDHRDPAQGGATTAENLKPLCRFHHRIKTFVPGWRDYQSPLQEAYFQSPTGHVYLGNAFTGRDLFAALRVGSSPPSEAAGWRSRERKRQRRATTIKEARQRERESEPAPPF